MSDYRPTTVRLFIKPYCGWCAQAMDWLDAHRVRYEVLDVIRDGKAYGEMVRLSGQTLAPVIEVDGRVLADFGVRELAAFWGRLDSGRGRA
jgi:glutaredoxin